ncbi:MAG: hypothetical protein HY348_04665 [Nitrospira defluvii]|nr:hypothetical protein [Nitrospira defluvii]
MTKDEAIALLKGPYSREMRKVATDYTSVIFWADRPGQGCDTRIGNGSVFFLDLGEGTFAVTADHVFQGYLDRKAERADLVCQIGNNLFDPEASLIDRDRKLDIATFRVDERTLAKDGKIPHRPLLAAWPPKPPDQGKGVFFSGFPRMYWSELRPLTFEWGSYFAITVATSVTDDYVASQFERSDMVDAFGSGLPPAGQWLGGLSGAALWTLVETELFSWRLGGVIYEYSSDFEILFARRPDRLKADGRLLH